MAEAPQIIRRTHPAWHLLGAGLVMAWLLAMAELAGALSSPVVLEELDRNRLAGHLEQRQQWFTIYLQQHRAGYLHRQLLAGKDGYRLRQRLRLALVLVDRPWRIDGRLEATLDSRGGLRRFSYRLSGGGIEGELQGRYRNGHLLLSGSLAGVKLQQRLRMTEPPLLDALLPLLVARHRLRIGHKYSARLFDPRRLANRVQSIEVLGRQVLDAPGGLRPAWHLRSGRAETKTEMWIGENGNLLRQDSALGLRLVASSEAAAREAVAAPVEFEAVNSGAVMRWLTGRGGE